MPVQLNHTMGAATKKGEQFGALGRGNDLTLEVVSHTLAARAACFPARLVTAVGETARVTNDVPSSIRVLIADDEPLVRAGIRFVLSNAAEVEVVAEASNGHDAVELARRHQVDVALLDIRMPALDGLAVAEQLADVAPHTAVLILTTFSEDEYVYRALHVGAAGFLLKDAPPSELINAVRVVMNGHAIVSPQITRRLFDSYAKEGRSRAEARSRVATLTEREREVLAMVGTGSSNAEIAEQLHVSEGTVKAYVSRILAKIGCTNRVQAAILSHSAGLLADRD
jgi:DNA-binding NarL/FixJ family response regulator